jgi:hypothetical protein
MFAERASALPYALLPLAPPLLLLLTVSKSTARFARHRSAEGRSAVQRGDIASYAGRSEGFPRCAPLSPLLLLSLLLLPFALSLIQIN